MLKVAFYTYNHKTYSELINYIRGLKIKLVTLPKEIRRYAVLKAPSRYKKHFQHVVETKYKGVFYIEEIARLERLDFLPYPNMFIKIR